MLALFSAGCAGYHLGPVKPDVVAGAKNPWKSFPSTTKRCSRVWGTR